MKYRRVELRQRLVALLRSVLDSPVQVSKTSVAAARFEVAVGKRGRGMRIGFTLAWAGEGWPADVEQVLAIGPRPDVVAARRLAPGSLDVLRRAGIGLVDETGRASIALPGLVVARDPRPNPTPVEGRPTWPTSRAAAAEAILAGAPTTVAGVEAATGFSRGAVTNALNELEREGLLVRPSARRGPSSVREPRPAPLRDAWAPVAAQWRARAPVIRLHALWNDPGKLAESVLPTALSQASWALTGTAGAELVAPYLARFTIVEIYVVEGEFDTKALADRLAARPTDRGHRLEVRVFPPATPHGVRLVDGLPVVSDARLYADLMVHGGRFEEAAQHLWEVTHGRATT